MTETIPVKPNGERRVRRVVVGLDGSSASTHALTWACREAAHREAELDLVCAWLEPTSADALRLDAPIGMERAEAVLRDAVERAEEMLPDEVADVDVIPPVVAQLARGAPVDVLVRAAQGATLLVVGGHANGESDGSSSGSVGRTLAGRPPCPLLIVPERAHAAHCQTCGQPIFGEVVETMLGAFCSAKCARHAVAVAAWRPGVGDGSVDPIGTAPCVVAVGGLSPVRPSPRMAPD